MFGEKGIPLASGNKDILMVLFNLLKMMHPSLISYSFNNNSILVVGINRSKQLYKTSL